MQTAFIGIPVAPGIAKVILVANADVIRANLKSEAEIMIVLNTPQAGSPHRITPNAFEIEIAGATCCPKYLFVGGEWVEIKVTRDEPKDE